MEAHATIVHVSVVVLAYVVAAAVMVGTGLRHDAWHDLWRTFVDWWVWSPLLLLALLAVTSEVARRARTSRKGHALKGQLRWLQTDGRFVCFAIGLAFAASAALCTWAAHGTDPRWESVGLHAHNADVAAVSHTFVALLFLFAVPAGHGTDVSPTSAPWRFYAKRLAVLLHLVVACATAFPSSDTRFSIPSVYAYVCGTVFLVITSKLDDQFAALASEGKKRNPSLSSDSVLYRRWEIFHSAALVLAIVLSHVFHRPRAEAKERASALAGSVANSVVLVLVAVFGQSRLPSGGKRSAWLAFCLVVLLLTWLPTVYEWVDHPQKATFRWVVRSGVPLYLQLYILLTLARPSYFTLLHDVLHHRDDQSLTYGIAVERLRRSVMLVVMVVGAVTSLVQFASDATRQTAFDVLFRVTVALICARILVTRKNAMFDTDYTFDQVTAPRARVLPRSDGTSGLGTTTKTLTTNRL